MIQTPVRPKLTSTSPMVTPDAPLGVVVTGQTSLNPSAGTARGVAGEKPKLVYADACCARPIVGGS